MRYAIISDIHSNLEALTAVLTDIDNERVDRIICLGDIVGYYSNPNECLEISRKRDIRCIAGNHDRVAAGLKEPTRFGEAGKHAILWTKGKLTPLNRLFLKDLPVFEMIDQRFLIVHGTLYPQPNEDYYLNSMSGITNNFNMLSRKYYKPNICFFGHTHQGVVYECHNERIVRLDCKPFRLNPASYYLINPGSVGQPRDNDKMASFLIFDAEDGSIEFFRVSYDWEKCHQKADQAGLLYREGILSRSANLMMDYVEAATMVIKRRWNRG